MYSDQFNGFRTRQAVTYTSPLVLGSAQTKRIAYDMLQPVYFDSNYRVFPSARIINERFETRQTYNLLRYKV